MTNETELSVNQKLHNARRAFTEANAAAKVARDKAKATAYAQFTYDKDRKALNETIRKINVSYTAESRRLADERDTAIARIYSQV